VEFNIFEELRGKPVTVVGTTNQVTGTITADPDALSSAMVSEIRINARTLKTDSAQRDGAIGRLILESEKDAYEYITFKPTRIEGLPEKATIGTAFDFKATGLLTIRDIGRQVTFTGTATFVSETELTGSAQTIIPRADFNLNIPDLPFLANLGKDVTLKVKLTAKK
jgi:polyisoprenoid-binding protein YceI